MIKRFAVRLNEKTNRWFVWDCLEERLIRSYKDKTCAESLCKYMTSTYKEAEV